MSRLKNMEFESARLRGRVKREAKDVEEVKKENESLKSDNQKLKAENNVLQEKLTKPDEIA